MGQVPRMDKAAAPLPAESPVNAPDDLPETDPAVAGPGPAPKAEMTLARRLALVSALAATVILPLAQLLAPDFWGLSWLIVGLLLAVMWGLAWNPRLSDGWRGAGLLTMMGLALVHDWFLGGPPGQAWHWLLLATLTTIGLFGRRAGLAALALALVLGAIGGWSAGGGRQTASLGGALWPGFALHDGLILIIAGTLIHDLTRRAATVLRQQQALTAAISRERGQLAQRVNDGTRILAMTAELSRDLTTILDQTTLVGEIARRVQAAFGFFYVHIYLLDGGTGILRRAGGAGATGRAPLLGRHEVPISQGLVGRAARLNQPVHVPDVRAEPEWLANQSLPETRAEIAVPIALGERVLGVLDVQQDRAGAFQTDDVEMLQTIANQAAVALRNAGLYEQALRHAEQEAVINRIGRRLHGIMDRHSLLQTLAHELGRELGFGVEVSVDLAGLQGAAQERGRRGAS